MRVLGNAKAQMHAPFFYAENSTTATYHTSSAAKAFGRQVSINARPTFSSSIYSLDTQLADVITNPAGNCLKASSPTGPTACSNCSDCMVEVAGQSAQLPWGSVCSSSLPPYLSINDWRGVGSRVNLP